MKNPSNSSFLIALWVLLFSASINKLIIFKSLSQIWMLPFYMKLTTSYTYLLEGTRVAALPFYTPNTPHTQSTTDLITK